MKKLFFIPVCMLFIGSFVFAQQRQLIKLWETDSVFKVPESVLYHAKENVLYVSNIDGTADGKDGKGSIGKLNPDGKVIAAEWVTGLNAPKGMGIYRNQLYVADVDAVVVIDLVNGTILRRIPVAGAVFLNDLTINKKGVIYVSDSRTSKVHRIINDNPTVYLENLKGPNGLLAEKNVLYVLNSGEVLKVGKDKSLKSVASGLESRTDGIERVKGNEFIISCWSGVVYSVKESGGNQMLLDTREQKMNTADIGYDAKKKIVYVPTFFKNSVVAYQLQ
jgi:hypothetical protein